MSGKHTIGYGEFYNLLHNLRDRIIAAHGNERTIMLYGVPRGGVPVALALGAFGWPFMPVDKLDDATVVVDDLIDSGATAERYMATGHHVHVLIDKRHDTEYKGKWIEFPWEQGSDGGIEDNIVRLLQFVGDDATREGLAETPKRVAKAWQHWCKGYAQDPAEVLKVFEDGAEHYDEMVVMRDLPFYSKCEHHLADIFGTATVAYVPDGKVVGISKLDRLLDVFARRLQVQERLTVQVADALMEHLKPKGAGVVIKARHMCMESRGVQKQGHHTVTSALRGVFRDQPSTRAEFLALAR